MAPLVADSGAALVLMHMQGTPATMQRAPHYEDVVTDIARSLAERAERARSAGVDAEAIVIDPGIGFGKTVEHNLEVLRRLPELVALGYPVLVGTSRKSFIGKVLAVQAEGRLLGSLATVVAARLGGASLFRVHDVAETRQVLAMTEAIRRGRSAESIQALTG
jgi:dihydropteroate synthase